MHRSRGLNEIRRIDVVAGPFGSDRVTDHLEDLFICRVVPEQSPEIGLLQTEQTTSQLSICSQAEAVAMLTEWLTDRWNKSDSSDSIDELEVH